jgi:hypothetical protein
MRTAQLKVNGIYARWEYGLGVPERLVLLELQGRGWILVRREDGEQERIRTDKLAGPFETVWHEYEEREAHARRLQLPSEDLIEVHGGLGEALGHRVDVDLERQRAAVLVAELRGDVGCGYPGCGQEAGGRVAEGVDNPIRLPLTQLVMGADRGRRATRRWPPGSSPPILRTDTGSLPWRASSRIAERFLPNAMPTIGQTGTVGCSTGSGMNPAPASPWELTTGRASACAGRRGGRCRHWSPRAARPVTSVDASFGYTRCGRFSGRRPCGSIARKGLGIGSLTVEAPFRQIVSGVAATKAVKMAIHKESRCDGTSWLVSLPRGPLIPAVVDSLRCPRPQ